MTTQANYQKHDKYFYVREPEGKVLRFSKAHWPQWFYERGMA
jgi:hypothetical protein